MIGFEIRPLQGLCDDIGPPTALEWTIEREPGRRYHADSRSVRPPGRVPSHCEKGFP